MVMPARHRGHRPTRVLNMLPAGIRVRSFSMPQKVWQPRPDSLIVQMQERIAADPCRYVGHRAAWLTRGGMACGRCGVRL